MRERRRRERATAHDRAAVEKEIQLADRQRERRGVGVVTPQAREASPLEPLRVHAETHAIPMEHFGADAIATEKEVHVAVQGIAVEALRHERAQPVEALAHVDRYAIRVHRDAAAVPAAALGVAPWSLQRPVRGQPSASTATWLSVSPVTPATTAMS
jgi:hypothetical protein